MLKSIVLAAAVASATAACPNQCSGHGYCDQNDRCVCFKTSSTKGNNRAAYIGADCSLRVCPYGRAHDQISDATQELLAVNYGDKNTGVALIGAAASSTNKLRAFLNNGFTLKADYGLDVVVKEVNANPASVSFQYKWSNQRTFNQEFKAIGTTYTGADSAISVKSPKDGSDTGLYLYWDLKSFSAGDINVNDRYYLNVTFNEGINLMGSDLNTAHGLIECSGRGACDRATGLCKCSAGYTGDACQRTECPNDCSGHGTCQSLNFFVDEATGGAVAYGGVDGEAQMGCKCDAGFRGADCSQIECPSGLDPNGGDGGAEGQDCSGRGTCDYTTGVCNCFKGYFGERCEEQSNLV